MMRVSWLVFAMAACGGAKPSPATSSSLANDGPAPTFHCDGRSARMQFSMTAGTWSHHAVRLSCDGDRPQIEVSGLRKDEDAERSASAPLDGATFERAWARLDAAGWTVLKGDDDCTSSDVDMSTQTSFEIMRTGTRVSLVCRNFPGSFHGAYDQIASALIETANAAGLDETSASKK
jgi:hypothetical protein